MGKMSVRAILGAVCVAGVVSLWGCTGSSASESGSGYVVSDNEETAAYKAEFDRAVDEIAAYDYTAASKRLTSLSEALAADVQNDVTFWRAETDYALGRVNTLIGDNDAAYDYYNSAYVYYDDLFGSDAPRTVDARLQKTFLSNEKEMVRCTDEIASSKADALYKNIAYCMSAKAFTDLDNNREANAYLKKINTFTKSGSGEVDDEQSADRLYGESGRRSSTLGRLTAVDQYRFACEGIAHYRDVSNDIKAAQEIYAKELASVTGDDLKSEVKREELLEVLGTLKLQYEGEAASNEYIGEALELAQKIYRSGWHLAVVNINIAEGYGILSNKEKFYEYYLKAEDILNAQNLKYNRTVALVKLREASYHVLKSQYDKAVEEAESALEIYKALVADDSEAIGSAYNILANCYRLQGDTYKFKEMYEKSIQTYRELGNELSCAVSLRNNALVTNNTLGDHTTALKLAREAISIVEELDHDNDGKTIAAIYMVMADILKPGDPEYSKIDEYSRKAFACLQNSVGNTDEYMANYYYNYGNYLLDNYRYDEALGNLKNALTYFEKVYDEQWQYPVNVIYDIGRCYYGVQEYATAREWLQKSVSYCTDRIENVSRENGYDYECKYLDVTKQEALDKISWSYRYEKGE